MKKIWACGSTRRSTSLSITSSIEQWAEALLSLQLGNQQPSALMSQIMRLMGTDDPKFLYLHLFFKTTAFCTHARISGMHASQTFTGSDDSLIGSSTQGRVKTPPSLILLVPPSTCGKGHGAGRSPLFTALGRNQRVGSRCCLLSVVTTTVVLDRE